MQILALHGFTGLGADFTPFAKLCDLANWHGVNLPGHGPNPQLDCSPKATVDFIQSQTSALKHQPSVLLGYSMGARAALLHAIRFPRQWQALILISPNPGIRGEQARAARRAVDEKLAQRIELSGVAAFIEFWQNTPMIRSQKNICKDWREAMQANRRQHIASGLAGSLRQFGQGQCPDLWSELNTVARPTLLLTGSEDQKYTRIAAEMADALPDATHHIIDNAGHMPHLENPDVCSDRIAAFLTRAHPEN